MPKGGDVPRLMLAIGALIVAIASQAQGQDPAGNGWYPRADDLCGEYVAKMRKPEQYGRPDTPMKDPAIAKYVADFNAANGTNDKGGLGLASLFAYCLSHAAIRLGDVTAAAVLADLRSTQSATSAEPSPAVPPAAQDARQDALRQCLQQTATAVIAACKERERTGSANQCERDLLPDIIGESQKMRCGYSAIQSIQTPQPSHPFDPKITDCTTTPTPGGGWVTNCFQF